MNAIDGPEGPTRYPNPVIEAIMTARAIRRFTAEPVTDDELWTCLRAAQQAPSGGNVQPVTYLVVTDADVKSRLGAWYRTSFDRYEAASSGRHGDDPRPMSDAQARSWSRTHTASRHLADHMAASPAIVLFLQPLIPWGDADDDGPIDIGRLDASVYPAVQNFVIAARSLGLGTTLTTVIRVNQQAVLDDLGVPAGRFEIAALVPVGRPAGHFGVASRKPVGAVTHWNEWGNRPGHHSRSRS